MPKSNGISRKIEFFLISNTFYFNKLSFQREKSTCLHKVPIAIFCSVSRNLSLFFGHSSVETVISCFDGNFNSLSFLNKTICNFHCFLWKNFFWWTKERIKLDFALWGIFPYEKKNHARRDIMVRFTLYVYAACNLLLRNFFH